MTFLHIHLVEILVKDIFHLVDFALVLEVAISLKDTFKLDRNLAQEFEGFLLNDVAKSLVAFDELRAGQEVLVQGDDHADSIRASGLRIAPIEESLNRVDGRFAKESRLETGMVDNRRGSLLVGGAGSLEAGVVAVHHGLLADLVGLVGLSPGRQVLQFFIAELCEVYFSLW